MFIQLSPHIAYGEDWVEGKPTTQISITDHKHSQGKPVGLFV